MYVCVCPSLQFRPDTILTRLLLLLRQRLGVQLVEMFPVHLDRGRALHF